MVGPITGRIQMVAGENRLHWLRGVVRSDESSEIGPDIGRILAGTGAVVGRSGREGKGTGGER